MRIPQLISAILDVSQDRGLLFAQRLNLADAELTAINAEASPSALRKLSREHLRAAGLTQKQTVKIEAALMLGRLAHVSEFSVERKVTSVEDPAIAAQILMNMLAFQQKEHAAAIVLDYKHRWLATELISIGTREECLFPPEEVFHAVLKHGGRKAIVAHNHPSGDLTPSQADIDLTVQMVKGGKILGIPVVDHLIIGDASFTSLRQTTPIWERLQDKDFSEL